MKNLRLLTLLIFTITSFGQTVDLRDMRHAFKYDIALNQCDFEGKPITPSNSQVMEKGWKFLVKNIVNVYPKNSIKIME